MVKLKQVQGDYTFYDEFELEHFVWSNLKAIFGFEPLTRQYYADENYADILALSSDRELVVIELKNSEELYLVRQLNWYYRVVIENKPFLDTVDYSKPVRLVGIAPSFHQSNLKDRLNSSLSIDFYSFDILSDQEDFICKLKSLPDGQTWELDLSSDHLPAPPRKLLQFLSQNYSEDLKGRILDLREKTLSFSEKEVYERAFHNSFTYSFFSIMDLIVEFKIHPKSQKLFLFINLFNPYQKQVYRTMICTADWVIADRLCHSPRGFQIDKYEEPDHQDPALFVRALGFNIRNPMEASRIDRLIDIALNYHLEQSNLLSKIPPSRWLEGTEGI